MWNSNPLSPKASRLQRDPALQLRRSPFGVFGDSGNLNLAEDDWANDRSNPFSINSAPSLLDWLGAEASQRSRHE